MKKVKEIIETNCRWEGTCAQRLEFPGCAKCNQEEIEETIVGCECNLDGLGTLYCNQCPLVAIELCRLTDKVVNWQKLFDLLGVNDVWQVYDIVKEQGLELPLLRKE